MIHLLLHVAVPFAIAKVWYAERWILVFAVLMLGMVIDVDHLLADPIYDPGRCSIGFHPLHDPWFIGLYLLLCLPPQTRLIGLGLSIHMALDSLDCQLTNGVWISPV